jgi:cation diffusion facilitator family transporter
MKAVVAALLANLGIAVVKFVAFLITGSASMLAEAVHSVADTGNQVLLLIGRGRSDRPRTAEHPFGFGRERYFYAFVVAVMLFTVGAAFSIYDGIHKMLHPEAVHDEAIALIVLAVAAVMESLSLRTGVHEANEVRGGRRWVAFIRKAKAPELPVVLLEDMAALIGLAFAFTGVSLAWATNDGVWDGAGSLAIGILLACAATILAVETKSLLIGESAGDEVERQVVAAIEDGPEVERVIHLRTVHVGPESVLVAAKIGVRPTDSAAQVAEAINAVEARIRAAVPIAKTIYLEPDIYYASRVDTADPSVQAAKTTRRPRIPRPNPNPRTLTAPAPPADRASAARASADRASAVPCLPRP